MSTVQVREGKHAGASMREGKHAGASNVIVCGVNLEQQELSIQVRKQYLFTVCK